MRIGIISDIHGNLPALEAVLRDIEERRFDALYCLGDLVGYAPFPNEVTERIRAMGIPVIMASVGPKRDETLVLRHHPFAA